MDTPGLTGDALLLPSVSRDFLIHHRLCPREYDASGRLVVAVAPDCLLDALDDLGQAYGSEVVAIATPSEEVDRLIERLATRAARQGELELLDGADLVATDVRNLASQPPVIRYVNLLIREAFDAAASDIHLESDRSGLSARMRLDGVLVSAPEAPRDLHHAVVSRIKLLAELDIAERRRPQDGRIRVRLEQRELDLRVSTVPTLFGESVVIRLLDRGGRPVLLEELGMPKPALAGMKRLARRPHGLVLVTGPTGSGKTTTLYAALALRDAAAEKIVTVEDPVEYELGGITQVPVHRQAGVTFSAALRSILRQDPDVLMVGEMRDAETADLAVQAAMTGHLVYSTLHTNDAIGAIPRLFDLGVDPYLVSATLTAVLAQRLVRRNCEHCSAPYQPATEVLARLPRDAGAPDRFTRGAGCGRCRGTGFRGRLGVFELIEMNDRLRTLVVERAPMEVLREAVGALGVAPLLADGWQKVSAGLTTAEEVLRVLHD